METRFQRIKLQIFMKRIAFVLIVIFVAGCAAPGHLNTPSGHPEVTVHATLQEAQKESVHWLLANGFTVGNQDPTKQILLISGNLPTNGGANNIWVTFNYYQPDSTTTTIYAKKGVWNRYSNITSPQTSQADYDELQQALNAIAQEIAASH
jgi:hypothetical protein